MKNYKINVFDEKEFYLTYQSNVTDKIKEDKDIIENHYTLFSNTKIGNLNKLIYDVNNFKTSDFVILSTFEDIFSQMMVEDEILNDPYEPAENNDDIYITDDGILCSGRCIDFTMSCIPDKKKKEFIYKKYSKKYSIILDKNKEKLYVSLENIGLNIVGISSNLYYSIEEGEEPDGNTYTNYLIKYSKTDKENFIEKSILYLEKQIKEKIKGPTIEKQKDNLLQDISNLDEEYGTKGKNIYLKDVNKDILLLLHLEGKIEILDFNSNTEFYININKSITKNDSVTEIKAEEKDEYYDKLDNKEIENVIKEKKQIVIYKNMQLISEDGVNSIKVVGKQKELCEAIFEEGLLKDKHFTFLRIEEEIYGEKQNIEALKGLIKEVKKKLTKLGYKKIIDYGDEVLLTSKK